MSAENPNQRSEQSLEEQEWQGQRWEYLIFKTHRSMREASALGKIKSKGIFSSKEQLDPVADHYDQKIKGLKTEQEGRASLTDILNLVGNDGWELVTGVNAFYLDRTGDAFLIFKRPLVTPEE